MTYTEPAQHLVIKFVHSGFKNSVYCKPMDNGGAPVSLSTRQETNK